MSTTVTHPVEPSCRTGRQPRPSSADDRQTAEVGIRALLRLVGDDPDRPGLVDTPARVVNAYVELAEHGSLTLSSGATASRPSAGTVGVGATNGAVDSIVRGLAIELAPIRVNAVSPGTVDAGAWDALGAGKEALFEARRSLNPVRRIGSAADVADAVLFLMTNTFATGVSLPIDGGEVLV